MEVDKEQWFVLQYPIKKLQLWHVDEDVLLCLLIVVLNAPDD
jgi:hypothetical protein